MGQLGTSTRLNCHWGLGCHLIFHGPVWSIRSCFCPSLRCIHILDSYDAGLPAPFWASSLEKPRHCRPNRPTSDLRRQKNAFPAVNIRGEILDGGPPKPCRRCRPLSIFWTCWRFALTTGQVQRHPALVSSRVVLFIGLVQ